MGSPTTIPRSPSTDSPWDVLLALYASEINASIESDWDGGVTAWVGHPTLSKRTFDRDEFDQVAAWMQNEARRHFPDSEYVKRLDR